ncbi:hypothetical protein D3C76_26160 [compost metagenome]
MPYAIYAVQANSPAHLGIDNLPDSVKNAPVQDARFVTFEKEPFLVIADLVRWLAELKLDEERRRVPDDLELMYPTKMKPFSKMENPAAQAVAQSTHEAVVGIRKLAVDAAFDDVNLRVMHVVSEWDEHALDEAIAVLRQAEHLKAVVRLSNPMAMCAEHSEAMRALDRAVRHRLSVACLTDIEGANRRLQEAFLNHTNLLNSMRLLGPKRDQSVSDESRPS